MNAYEIASQAVQQTRPSGAYVSAEVRQSLAIAAVALVIDGMDESIPAHARIRRLSDAIAEVRKMLGAP